MQLSEQANQLLTALKTAYQDPQIQADAELNGLLVKNSQELLKTGNYHQVAADLNRNLQFYGMKHINDAPQALNPLYQATINATHGRAYQKVPTGFH